MGMYHLEDYGMYIFSSSINDVFSAQSCVIHGMCIFCSVKVDAYRHLICFLSCSKKWFGR